MSPVSKILIFAGVILILAGLAWHFAGKGIPLGRLPGDIAVEKPGFRLYFPLATSLLLSVVLSLLLWIYRRWFE